MNQPKRKTFANFEPAKLLLLLFILLGFALRLYRLGADSLWYDETVSAFLASETIPDLIAHTARDIHPPGYYLLLHLWRLAAGQTEFALAFFSLSFGILIIPLTYRLARLLAQPNVALATALLLVVSPYQIWYAQEVRMYTLGATLGLAATYCGLSALISITRHNRSPEAPRGPTDVYKLAFYFVAATLGLYTLYYFAFLLLVINCFLLLYALRPSLNMPALRSLIGVNSLVLIAYLPWLPTAWRQATEPPVPPWRTIATLSPWPVLVESWSALSLGQSVEPSIIWPLLLLTLTLFILGFLYIYRPPAPPIPRSPAPLLPCSPASRLFLLTYTFGPLLLIYLFSFITPLYHVRYVFTYSPAFYIIIAAGFVWLMARHWTWAAIAAACLLFGGYVFSLYQYHFDPRYRADDYRAAVAFIDQHWQPGDVILVNAGYVYPAFLYYTNLPKNLQRQRLVPYHPTADRAQPLLLQTGSVGGATQLGWGDPRSDFYAMSAVETTAALEGLSHNFARLWLLRAYDTVTDPPGLIRDWLAGQTIPLEDELFSGESSIRAQGFLLPGANVSPLGGEPVAFEDGLGLSSWSLPGQAWQAGQTIHAKLWWRVDRSPSLDYKMSLKLWTPDGKLAAQGQDTWPAGTLYRATAWPIGQSVYQAAAIELPTGLASGQYWLNVELYRPDTGLPLPRLDGAAPVVTLGPVTVQN